MDSYREIENLVYDMAWLIDNEKEYELITELFKGCMLIAPPNMTETPAHEMAEWSRKSHRRWGPDQRNQTQHQITNLKIEVDEEAGTAKTRCYLTIMQAVPEVGFPLQPIFCGTYHDTFNRNAKGKWRYATHMLVTDLMGECCNHRVDFSDSQWEADEMHPDRRS